jgi:predicted DNA-binding transcriptional regulator AlpA
MEKKTEGDGEQPLASNPNRLLKIKEAAAMFGVASSLFYRTLRWSLPSVTIGKRSVRFRLRDVEEYIANLESQKGQPGK